MAQPIKLRDERLQWRAVEGETIAVDLESSNYLAFNPTATELWQLLLDGTTEDALIGRLVELYGIPREQAATDVRAFLDTLAANGLLDG
jgi:hypothetical protein